MPNVHTRVLRPTFTTGADGIPDYVSAVRGDPRRWLPPVGKRLEVHCDGVLLRYVLEADRVKGWVLTKKMLEKGDGSFTEILGSEMFYQGRVTFRLVDAQGVH